MTIRGTRRRSGNDGLEHLLPVGRGSIEKVAPVVVKHVENEQSATGTDARRAATSRRLLVRAAVS